ncbi:hypothetical protein B0A55_03330 [Friedmanniomyces simplex]|uniref:Uncharacterized protein n=1 Tax=Friedmanniomyces simplex TaxID=329884 RepID=A0A4U0XTY8_9PEZI|nr:hypothetical protein B0A55_03330 [Friedmanniomyces simplex]
MARERAENAARQREGDAAHYVDDRLRRDADVARYNQSQHSPRMPPHLANISPLSARSPAYPVAIHQHPTIRRDSTLEEQGEAIIAREQARAQRETTEAGGSRRAQPASRRLSYAMGDLTAGGSRGMGVEVDLEDDEVSERLEDLARRRAERAAERAERRGDFWK